MKLNLDKRYTKFCKYLIFTSTIIFLIFKVIDAIPSISETVFDIIGTTLDISFPIILGFIIAYLLYMPMNSIEKFLMSRKHFPKKRGLCRGIALLISYMCLLGIVLFLIIGIYTMIGGQLSKSSTLSNIIGDVSVYLSSNSLSTDSIADFIEDKNIPFGDTIINQLDNIADGLQDFLISLVNGFADFIISLGSNLFTFIAAFILSIYVLFSHEYFTEIWNRLFFVIFKNSRAGRIVKHGLSTLNSIFSKYIRGQLIEATLVAIMSYIVLSVLSIDYAFVIAITAGITNLVPYIGPFVGIFLAAIVTLLSGEIFSVIAVVIGLLIVQQIDSNILCPKIVGDIVGLQPGLILIALSIGGSLFGLLGMLIAVPIAASLKILINDVFEYYYAERYEEYKKKNSKADTDQSTDDDSADTPLDADNS